MNTKKFKEILEQSTHIDSVADYEIRRYTNSGGYVICLLYTSDAADED